MTISYVNQGSRAASATVFTVGYPSSVTAGNLLLLFVSVKYSDITINDISDWTSLGRQAGGTGAQGGDSGELISAAFYRVADGTESGSVTLSFTGSINTFIAWIMQYSKTTGTWSVAAAKGADNTAGTAWSVTGDTNPGVTAGDMIVVGTGINGNAFTTVTSPALSQTGVTFGAANTRGNDSSSSGHDSGMVITDHEVSSGTGSAAPVYTATISPAVTNSPTGTSFIVRLREDTGGGGTQYEQNVSGALTPSGAILRQTRKSYGGTLTPAGALSAVKTILRALGGAVSPSGALATVKTILRALGGALTPSGAILRQTSKSLSGTLTPAGALSAVKTILRALSGSVTATGALVRRTTKTISGTLAPSGVVVGMKTLLRALGGSVSPSGSLAKLANKQLSGALAPAGALARQTRKALTGTVTAAGALTRALAKTLGGALTPTGALSSANVFLKAIGGVIAPSGTLARRVGKALDGAVTPSGEIARHITKTIAGAVTPAGVVLKLVTKTLSGALTPIGTLARRLLGEASALPSKFRGMWRGMWKGKR